MKVINVTRVVPNFALQGQSKLKIRFQCPICLLWGKSVCKFSGCSHATCVECFQRLITLTCPLCRTPYKVAQEYKLPHSYTFLGKSKFWHPISRVSVDKIYIRGSVVSLSPAPKFIHGKYKIRIKTMDESL